MLGSLPEAEDAVQEAWLRLSRTDLSEVASLKGWLTTVVARLCLDMLRQRKARREELIGTPASTPIVVSPAADSEEEVALIDEIGLALLVVLATLAPAERVAFVLHDLFDQSFEDIEPIVSRTPVATRQLASRARRRLQGATPEPAGLARQRTVVEAFLAACRSGDVDAVLAVLDPDVVLRADRGTVPVGAPRVRRGAVPVPKGAVLARAAAQASTFGLVDGVFALVARSEGRITRVLVPTVVGDRIVAIDVIAHADRLARLHVAYAACAP